MSNRATGWAERTLRSRLAEGREDPERLDERRGIASLPRPDGPLIWLHAASVGESVSLLEMIRRMGEERPDLHFLMTTGTVTSSDVLRGRLPARALHQFVPLDVAPWMRRFLKHWKPDLCVLAESELWPAMIEETDALNVPIALINARMSVESHRRWRRAGSAAQVLLARIAHVQAQDQKTAERLFSLGLPEDRLEVTGTLKEGSAALPHDEDERVRLAANVQGRPCWLAASTHEDEEEIVARAHREALQSWQRLLLVLVPRQPNRADGICAGLRGEGWKVARRSAGEDVASDTQIYLADTMGELGLWYRLCPVSFVGGSLVDKGGHNPFEPAALGSAILHGPHIRNFADIYARLAEADGARLVQDPGGLGRAVIQVLEPDVAARLAHSAWEVCSTGAEVTEGAMDLLFAMLDGVD